MTAAAPPLVRRRAVDAPEPAWVRGIRWVDGGVAGLVRAYDVIRDELLFALVDPRARTSVTAAAYSAAPSKYAPGAPIFEMGLYDWERAAVRDMGLPVGGRLLVGGIGGGRELPELATSGFEIVAFEPAESLCEGAVQVAAPYPRVSVHRASYADYVSSVRGREGPLACVEGPFDGILLGWGSFNHVTTRADQVAVLSALREGSPRAPVLVSVAARASAHDIGGDDRLRRPLRALMQRLTGRVVEPGLRYETRCAFIYRYTPEELRELAETAGYRVLRLERCTYQQGPRTPAYALLAPA